MTGEPAGRVVLVAVGIGIVNAVAFLSLEWIVDHGTRWLWDDVLDTDERRWMAVVAATALGVGYSCVLRLLGQPRWVPPHTDPLAGNQAGGSVSPAQIVMLFVVGAVSLLAGASLGPEAPLVAVSAAAGAWLAGTGRVARAAPVLVMASVGALLVVFLGSLVVVVVPVLLLYRRQHSLAASQVLAIVVAALSAYATECVIAGRGDGYGTIPAGSSFGIRDCVSALVVGALAVVVARGLKRTLTALAAVTRRVDGRLPWPLAGALFGAALGGLYLVGGPTVEFSGSDGTGVLLQRAPSYTAGALVGLLVVKLLATGWSLASGYRGGLVFPSIYVAVAFGLFVARVAGDAAGPGILVGAVAGMLAAMTGPAITVIMLLALLPVALAVVAALGAAGAALGDRALSALTALTAATRARRPSPP